MGRFEQVRANLRRAYAAGRESVRAARAQAKAPDQVLDEAPPGSPAPDPTAVTHPSTISLDDADLPRGLRVAAAWSWRLLVVGLLGYAVLRVVILVNHVIVPLAISLLLAALLAPAVARLRRRNVPPSLATAIVLVGGILAVAGTLTLVVNQFINGLPDLTQNASDGVREIQQWLKTGPLHLSDAQFESAIAAGENWVDQNRGRLTTAAGSTAAATFDFLAGLFLVLFSLFFFLRDGRKIWRYIVRVVPTRARESLHNAGEAAWGTLSSYVRATVLVAFIDAVGIGIAVFALRVPLAFPLAALVFLAAFIPIVGATLSGAVAVLVALVTRGPITALILLAAVIAVQQIEGHVLQPIIMGRAVAIHPLAVIVAIATGVAVAGIIGALIAVPIVAVLNTGIKHLMTGRWEPPPDAVVVASEPPHR